MTNPTLPDADFHFDPTVHEVYLPDGRQATSTVIDELAAKAEKNGPPPWLTPGGKSLSGDGSHSPSIHVVLPRGTAEAVKARAAAEHMSVSKWARRALEAHLAAS